MTQELYAILGSTGEYEDYQEWIVATYLDYDLAAEHRNLAQEYANRFEENRKSKWQSPPAGSNPYDPFMTMQSSGTSYDIEHTELRTELPNPHQTQKLG